MKLAEDKFEIEMKENYDDAVWDQHCKVGDALLKCTIKYVILSKYRLSGVITLSKSRYHMLLYCQSLGHHM